MKNFDSLARWPLLLGSVVMFAIAAWEAANETDPNRPIGYAAVALGSMLLGAWVWSLAVEAERKWHTRHERPPEAP